MKKKVSFFSSGGCEWKVQDLLDVIYYITKQQQQPLHNKYTTNKPNMFKSVVL